MGSEMCIRDRYLLPSSVHSEWFRHHMTILPARKQEFVMLEMPQIEAAITAFASNFLSNRQRESSSQRYELHQERGKNRTSGCRIRKRRRPTLDVLDAEGELKQV